MHTHTHKHGHILAGVGGFRQTRHAHARGYEKLAQDTGGPGRSANTAWRGQTLTGKSEMRQSPGQSRPLPVDPPQTNPSTLPRGTFWPRLGGHGRRGLAPGTGQVSSSPTSCAQQARCVPADPEDTAPAACAATNPVSLYVHITAFANASTQVRGHTQTHKRTCSKAHYCEARKGISRGGGVNSARPQTDIPRSQGM